MWCEEVGIAHEGGDASIVVMNRKGSLVATTLDGDVLDHQDVFTLLGRPDAIQALSLEMIPSVLCQLSALQAALAARLLSAGASPPNSRPANDSLLDVDTAAERLGTSADWLYRNARKLPFTVRLGARQLRFSATGIDRWISTHRGR